MAEDVRARNLMFLEQPADQRRRSGGLRRSKRAGFAADAYDADGTSVSAHTMIRAISVVYHSEIHFRRYWKKLRMRVTAPMWRNGRRNGLKIRFR